MKKILICGSSGFIGRNLLDNFTRARHFSEEEFEVKAVWHKNANITELYRNVEWVQGDLTNSKDVQRIVTSDIDVILQYAAVTSGAKDIVSKPYVHVTDNAVMNSLLMREAFEKEVGHFIFPSCTLMYQSSDELLKETDVDENVDIFSKYYGAGNTKLYLEKMCKFYSDLGKTKFTVLRQSNIYGTYDKFDLERSHVFAATIVKVVNAIEEIVVWGEGKEKRDLLHVEDLVSCVEKVMKQESQFELINVGIGSGIEISELVKKVVDIYKKDLYIRYDKTKPSFGNKLALDISRAKDLFGWIPTISIEEGIQKTLNHYEEVINE